MLGIRTTLEMMRVHAQQRKLGATAQNRCIELIAMTEKRIGEELLRERAAGRLLKANENRPRKSDGGDAYRHSIAELGLTKQQNRDFTAMAPVPVEVIHETGEAVDVPAMTQVRFRPGQGLKEAVNGGRLP